MIEVRPAAEADFPALTRLDLTYPTDRYLEVARSGESPELTFALRWRTRHPAHQAAVYANPTVDWLRKAAPRADLFLIALADAEPAGYLIAVVPSWTDAAEITDLAVDNAHRRLGAGSALVRRAAQWAAERSYRALWTEPRADNYDAVTFYTSLGFRLAGFNDRFYSNRDHEAGRVTLFMYLELG